MLVLVCRNEFTCKITGNTYKLSGNLSCYNANVVYLISCKLCKISTLGLPIKKIKPKFRVNKSDIKTVKDRCG